MRILLVQPDYNPGPVGYRAVAMPEPLALELLAAMVGEHEVRILDLRVDPSLDELLASFAPDVVATTALTTEVYAARDILKKVKAHSPEIFTTVGGYHATLMPADFQLPYVDAVCLGEGEFVFADLVRAVERGRDLAKVPNLIWRTPDGSFTHNGWTVPPADGDLMSPARRDLVARYRDEYFWLYDKPHLAIATGRGCPYRCNFCSVWEFFQGRTRQMSAARVVDELRAAKTRHVTFVDDNFMLNARRENEIADRIKAEGIQLTYGMECRTDSIVRHPELIEKWAGLGLECVLLGLEGISDDTLVNVNKANTAQANNEAIRILRANGVMIWGAFIVDPDWTAEPFKALHDYAYEKKITHVQFSVLTPFPGTELYRQRRNELITNDYTCFDALHAVLPTRLPREEFYRHLASLYLRPNIGAVYQYLDQGRLTLEQIRYGQRIYQQFGRWENYIDGDPVLGVAGRTSAADTVTK